MKFVTLPALVLAGVLGGTGAASAWAQGSTGTTAEAALSPAVAVWPPLGIVAGAPQVETAAEEITQRLAQDVPPTPPATLSTGEGEPVAQGPSVPSFEPGVAPAPETPPVRTEPIAPSSSLPLPPNATSPSKPGPAAKACLFAAASTLPLVPDAKITSASAAPIGSMAGEGLYRDFRVILIVDALGMTTTVEFACRSADTPEIFGAEILSARILE